MAIRFYGRDPETDGNHCPSVSVDEESGDFLFVGPTVTDGHTLEEIALYSPIAEYELAVRVPARMARIIAEAVNGRAGSAVR